MGRKLILRRPMPKKTSCGHQVEFGKWFGRSQHRCFKTSNEMGWGILTIASTPPTTPSPSVSLAHQEFQATIRISWNQLSADTFIEYTEPTSMTAPLSSTTWHGCSNTKKRIRQHLLKSTRGLRFQQENALFLLWPCSRLVCQLEDALSGKVLLSLEVQSRNPDCFGRHAALAANAPIVRSPTNLIGRPFHPLTKRVRTCEFSRVSSTTAGLSFSIVHLSPVALELLDVVEGARARGNHRLTAAQMTVEVANILRMKS